MSQPDHERIIEEIRGSRIPASPELRARVSELAAAAAAPPAPPRRRELPWRRWSLVLAPVAVAGAAAAALAIGLADSGKHAQHQAAGQAGSQTLPFTDEQSSVDTATPRATPSRTFSKTAGTAAGGAVPATAGRAQLYESELTLKVGNLSTATKRALNLTRAYHGYVRRVDYGTGSESGTAYLVLRVPIGSVQAALVKFSSLGEIIDQHVSIQDVQPTVDRRFRQMQSIRDQIAKIQAKLESPTLTTDERTALENQLVATRRQLLVLQKQQAALQRQTSFATVSVSLRTKDKAVVVPNDPGRIERALGRAGSIVLDEVKVVLYVLIVGAPLLALAFLGFGGAKVRRRRAEERLLSTS